ncbi:MAG: hypothetical protein IJ335_04215 [Lachnospiraceae bacterium]|nr:hypothetical protein [Lachnospiraceae bacterium]
MKNYPRQYDEPQWKEVAGATWPVAEAGVRRAGSGYGGAGRSRADKKLKAGG